MKGQLVCIIVEGTQDGASAEFERYASRKSLENPQSRLGYSILGAKWRDFDGRGAILHVKWQCCFAAAESVADWILCEDDLMSSFTSANVGKILR